MVLYMIIVTAIIYNLLISNTLLALLDINLYYFAYL
jgi:hypothetical protein